MSIATPSDDIDKRSNKDFSFGYRCELVDRYQKACNFEFSFDAEPSPPKRDWSTYNKGQTNEQVYFDALLKDLVDCIPEPEQKMGRPRIPNSKLAFFSVKKVASRMSSRRVQGTFDKDAPHFNASSRFLMDKKTTGILQSLIHVSSLPLAGLEIDFAVDSTGFSTTAFGQYCIFKHKKIRKHKWQKLHLCTGVKTNVVTYAIVTDSNVADITQFKELVELTSLNFDINEVSADKAYSSRANYDLLGKLGGQAFIPFKSNATGRAGGSRLWRDAYHLFQLNRDEFDDHYHKRSNVETTIGAIKAKFGETLKSKSKIAQRNELLCKILAYNITVLIREMYVNGIDLHLNSDW